MNLDSEYINSQFNIVFDDWFATVPTSLESLPDLNSPEGSKMFGESTFQFSFDGDDDSDGEEQFFDSNQDLPAALDRLHKAVSSAMDKHRSAIPLPIVPDAEDPIPSASLPILVETVDGELPIRPPASPLVYPLREQPVDESQLIPPARPIVYPPRESPSPSPIQGSIHPLLQGSPLCRSVEGSLSMKPIRIGR